MTEQSETPGVTVATKLQVFAAVKAPAPSVPQVIVPLGVFAPLARVTVAVQTVPENTVTGLVAQLTVVVVLASEDSPTAKSLMAVTPVACVLVAVRVPLVVADHILGNINGNELLAVVHAKCQSDKVREDGRATGPGLDDR